MKIGRIEYRQENFGRFNPSALFHRHSPTAYLRAWQDYCCDTWEFGLLTLTTANPYAIMAQAKLIPIP